MLSAHRALVAMRIASPRTHERHTRTSCISVSRQAAVGSASFPPPFAAVRPLAVQRPAGTRSLHFCPPTRISNVPRATIRQSDTTTQHSASADSRTIRPTDMAGKPTSATLGRYAPKAADGAISHPAPSSALSGTASQAAAPPIDTSAPIAYQDMGRNQPKLYLYTSNHRAADALSPAPLPSLVARPASHLPQQDARTDKQIVLDHFFTAPLTRRLFTPFAGLLQHMLPKGYPHSVSASYGPYSQYTFVQCLASTASGVLSMQCLLFAVGLGQPLAVPAAAAVQWVMKDGLGQLGGMLFASYVNVSFDSDAKRWRMIAAMLQDGSVLVEMCTPLVPGLFLPLASAANIGKNVAWLSTSASRACIHRSFCREENLADVTAKSGSQSIAASLFGTALGIGLSYTFGTAVLPLLGVFAVLSCLHLGSTYVSLRRVPLNTLNDQRGERAMLLYCTDGRVPSTDEVKDHERFVVPYRSPLANSRLDMTAELTDVVSDFDAMAPHMSSPVPVVVWSGLSSLDRLLLFYADEAFLLTVRPSASSPLPYTVSLLFLSSATSADVLSAYLLQVRLRLAVKQLVEAVAPSTAVRFADVCALLQRSVEWLREHRNVFLQQLAVAGWNVEHLFLESDRQRRVHLLQTRVRAVRGSGVRKKAE